MFHTNQKRDRSDAALFAYSGEGTKTDSWFGSILVNVAEKKEVVKNFDHLAKLKYSPVNPTAFTERGLYMLATILKGRVATQTTINIINTFVEIRELSRAIARVPEVVDENEKKSLLKRSGEIISNVLASDSTSLESETEIELNLAMVKIRHKIKKKSN